MTEEFLAYLWQFQYFNKNHLQTEAGQSIVVIYPGKRNTHAGPDFFEAVLQIENLRWYGNIEIHVKTSHWLKHGHQVDRAYESVILHVVWENDLAEPICRSDKSPIPVLSLKGRVDPLLWERYAVLMVPTSRPIACATQLHRVPTNILVNAAHQMIMRRLYRKSEEILQWLAYYRGHWQQVTYMLLMRNMGFKTNAEAMLQLAQRLPYDILRKVLHERTSVEALLLGMAGWLDDNFSDDYLKQLQKEFWYLAHKFDLKDKKMHQSAWKTARMRPANFPVRRLAQAAALLCHLPDLFSSLVEIDSISTLKEAFQVPPSPYWQKHYLAEKTSARKLGGLGEESANTLIINTLFPILTAYARHGGNPQAIEKALQLLQQLPAETNAITRRWQGLPLPLQNAADSQAVIELYNEFCTPCRCLQCSIGMSLVQGEPLQNP
ncbi:MAG: DUF2851 family protein [Cytophagales bacterium]|nr:DUF2851 family protein [Cytophagales bacterium]